MLHPAFVALLPFDSGLTAPLQAMQLMLFQPLGSVRGLVHVLGHHRCLLARRLRFGLCPDRFGLLNHELPVKDHRLHRQVRRRFVSESLRFDHRVQRVYGFQI